MVPERGISTDVTEREVRSRGGVVTTARLDAHCTTPYVRGNNVPTRVGHCVLAGPAWLGVAIESTRVGATERAEIGQ